MRVCLHSINSGKAHDQHLPNAASANENRKTLTGHENRRLAPRPHAGLLWVLAGLLSFAGALTNTYGYRRVVNTQRENVSPHTLRFHLPSRRGAGRALYGDEVTVLAVVGSAIIVAAAGWSTSGYGHGGGAVKKQDES